MLVGKKKAQGPSVSVVSMRGVKTTFAAVGEKESPICME